MKWRLRCRVTSPLVFSSLVQESSTSNRSCKTVPQLRHHVAAWRRLFVGASTRAAVRGVAVRAEELGHLSACRARCHGEGRRARGGSSCSRLARGPARTQKLARTVARENERRGIVTKRAASLSLRRIAQSNLRWLKYLFCGIVNLRRSKVAFVCSALLAAATRRCAEASTFTSLVSRFWTARPLVAHNAARRPARAGWLAGAAQALGGAAEAAADGELSGPQAARRLRREHSGARARHARRGRCVSSVTARKRGAAGMADTPAAVAGSISIRRLLETELKAADRARRLRAVRGLSAVATAVGSRPPRRACCGHRGARLRRWGRGRGPSEDRRGPGFPS